MRNYIIMLLLTVFSFQARAQRMVYKQQSVELNTGVSAKGELNKNFYINLALTSYRRHGHYWIWGAEYQKRTVNYRSWAIPLENYLGEAGYSLRLLADRKKFISLNAALTVLGGYEIVNKGDSLLQDGGLLKNRNQFVYGSGGRLSLDTYLSDRIVLVIQTRLRMLWGTDLEHFRASGGIGFKFNF
jgi:hypothetical protein